MQASSVIFENAAYSLDMSAGRPSKFPRSVFGERLFSARLQIGFSQIQLAEKLGVTQQTYAGWERKTTAIKPEYICRLSEILRISTDFLLGHENDNRRNGSGPIGKARQTFEKVSQLPRHQQQKILEVVEALVERNSNGHKQAA